MEKLFIGILTFICSYLILKKPLLESKEDDSSKKTMKTILNVTSFIAALVAVITENPFGIIIFVILLRLIYSKAFKKNEQIKEEINNVTENNVKEEGLECKLCGNIGKPGEKFCTSCGTKFFPDESSTKVYANPEDYEAEANLSLYNYIDNYVKKELEKAGIDLNQKLITSQALKRKNIMSIMFSSLLFIYISLLFFHFPSITYIIGLIILAVLFILACKFSLYNYIIKQIKSRPNEKISNIVLSIKTSLVKNNSRVVLLISTLIAICMPLVIFKNPRIFYEKLDNGYGVRFYTYGLNNNTKAVIPETYKGKNVVSLRGNTFSGMKDLTEIILPNTITEIRGQAFMGLEKLTNITLPNNLEYLGGGAFKNCTSLESITIPSKVKEINGDTFLNATSLKTVELPEGLEKISGSAFMNTSSLESINIPSTLKSIGGSAFKYSSIKEIELPNGLQAIDGGAFANCDNLTKISIPDTVTYLGGEAFQFDSQLKEVKLSNSLTEIRGNTFEDCISLSTITIPDNVTRIGGHAFYGTGLKTVILTRNSKLQEIGSSAFRRCYTLTEITLPSGVSMNERAFKESPTVIKYFN